jgi:hypothetical protein
MQCPAVMIVLSEMIAPPHIKAGGLMVNIPAIQGYLLGFVGLPLTILPLVFAFDSPQAKKFLNFLKVAIQKNINNHKPQSARILAEHKFISNKSNTTSTE